jgi:molybdate/tungstate transport system permease protein
MGRTRLSWLFSILGGLVLLFILAPLAGLFLNTSASQFFGSLNDKDLTGSIWLTLSISFVATLLFSTGAIPLAYLLARQHFVGKNLVQSLIDLPIVIPHSAAGIALLGLVSRESLIGRAASGIGLDFVGHPIGIGLAMAFVSVPFLIQSARTGFEAVPERLEKAAMNLGASPWKVFRTVSLPLAKRSIITGLVMMFSRGLSEFGAVVIIAYYPMVTPVLIWDRFNAFGLNYARPAAAVFLLVCLVFFVILRIFANRTDDQGRKHQQESRSL